MQHPLSPRASREYAEIEAAARRNVLAWTMLFSGSATVPFLEVMRWPARKGVEMLIARRIYNEATDKMQDELRAKVEKQAKTPQQAGAKWWDVLGTGKKGR